MAIDFKYRIHEVAKDFGLTSKVVGQIVTDYSAAPKNHMQVLEEHIQPPRVQGVLGTSVLLRRLRRQRLPRNGQCQRHLRVRLQALQKAHGVCDYGRCCSRIGRMI